MLLSQGKRLTPQTHALMVKRLRRRPLTAESGVRFPMRVPKKAAKAAFFLYLNRGTKKGSRGCFFSLPQQGYQKRQQKLLFSLPRQGYQKRQQKLLFFIYLDRGTKKRQQKLLFLFTSQGYQKRQQKLLFFFTSTGVPKKAAKAAFFYLPRLRKAHRQCLHTQMPRAVFAQKKRRGGIETPRRCAPKTRNSHDAVWCHFINLHVQGGSTAAACFCLPLDEGA